MERKPIESSNIVSVGFDAKTKTLEIEFRGGAVYQYDGIADATHQELVSSESPGAYFARSIRPNWTGRRV